MNYMCLSFCSSGKLQKPQIEVNSVDRMGGTPMEVLFYWNQLFFLTTASEAAIHA